MNTIFTDIESSQIIVFVAYFLAFAIQIFFWFFFFSRGLYYRPAVSKNHGMPVSVVICARDEEENLKKNLPFILRQKYPDFEVIVINDCSSDGTEDVLRELKKEHSNLRTTTIKEDKKFKHGKKLALTIGIKSAKNEWLLLTDADCQPESEFWIAQMQRHFASGSSIVLGYGGYYTNKGLLNIIIRFETFFIALQYFSFALAGVPYMGVGRNLAYRKSLFFYNKGFAGHTHLISGDDDLFINETATGKNTRVELGTKSHTRSSPPETWREWYFQKKRHLLTGPKYKTLTKFILGLEILSRLIFYSSFVFLTIKAVWPPLVLSSFAFRCITMLVIIKIMTVRLNEKHLLLPSPLLDLLLPLVNLLILFINYIENRRNRWK